jgi:hypothetical protein
MWPLFAKAHGRQPFLIELGSLLGALGTLSILIIIYILAKLSERFGAVIKMRPRYRYYYLALIFLFIGWLAQLLVLATDLTPTNVQSWLNSSWFLLLAYYLPLTIGVTIGLVITWRYWSWLVAERNG